MGAEQEETAPKRRRFGCCSGIVGIAALVVLVLAGSLIFWIVGTPFDGWSRSDERHVRTVCVERGGTERFCDCFINELQQEGVAYDEINPQNGRKAGFVCGAFFQF